MGGDSMPHVHAHTQTHLQVDDVGSVSGVAVPQLCQEFDLDKCLGKQAPNNQFSNSQHMKQGCRTPP